MLKEYPRIEARLVNAGKVTEIAGYLMAFTVPVIALYLDGREVLREARFIPVEKLRDDLKRIYEGVFDV
ncbi:thioredoxin [Cytobacillus firmus]|uniref:thioredoxin n=1 Tax=Cytobacillus firmus TaxID=1399 RepID=UPI0021C5790D|nr:thioredoxin [Cytobacillus firmus]MCU1807402.1 thioredoxin [Cytobacillus firmus]